MSDVPKIVYDRLRATTPRDSHPNADLLTAFTEQALSATERENVVRHLARCADCREITALSIPPLPELAPRPQAAQDPAPIRRPVVSARGWLAWPNLRWAAMAAAVVVVGSVLLLRPGSPIDPGYSIEHGNIGTNAATPAADQKLDAVDSATPLASSDEKKVTPSRAPAMKTQTRSPVELRYKPLEGQSPKAPAIVRDNGRADSLQIEDKNISGRVGSAPSPAPASRGEIAATHPTIESSAEAVTVGAAPMETLTSIAPTMARNTNDVAAPPIVKSKPAAKEQENAEQKSKTQEYASSEVARSNTSSLTRLRKQASTQPQEEAITTQWAVSGGKLRRSYDAGATWQPVIQPRQNLMSVSGRGADVWVGGQGGALFHSTDGGTNWTAIQPSTGNESLTADIIQIQNRSTTAISLSTNSGETWTTSDNGKTWQRK